MKVQTVSGLSGLEEDIQSLGRAPFASPAFHLLFEKAGVVGPGTGWMPCHFLAWEEGELAGFLPAYIKTDSFGEFIFDWAWADLYRRARLPYYPKLTCANPFSPVDLPKALGSAPAKEALWTAFAKFIEERPELSSAHALFIDSDEASLLERQGFFTRKSLQYHLDLKTKSFEDFLASLKARKRKQIRKERQGVAASGLRLEMKTEDFGQDFMDQIYLLYLNTIEKKWGQAYLNREFFRLLGREWSENLAVACAWDDKGLAAMSLFIKSADALYGRYWGAREDVDIPYLHFELSYYQGMEFCLQNGITHFEAGAQGEQKLLRGFAPTEILSAHKLCLGPLHNAIQKHVRMENAYVELQIKDLARHLPYKAQSF